MEGRGGGRESFKKDGRNRDSNKFQRSRTQQRSETPESNQFDQRAAFEETLKRVFLFHEHLRKQKSEYKFSREEILGFVTSGKLQAVGLDKLWAEFCTAYTLILQSKGIIPHVPLAQHFAGINSGSQIPVLPFVSPRGLAFDAAGLPQGAPSQSELRMSESEIHQRKQQPPRQSVGDAGRAPVPILGQGSGSSIQPNLLYHATSKEEWNISVASSSAAAHTLTSPLFDSSQSGSSPWDGPPALSAAQASSPVETGCPWTTPSMYDRLPQQQHETFALPPPSALLSMPDISKPPPSFPGASAVSVPRSCLSPIEANVRKEDNTETKIHWSTENVGTFFINKVYLDEAKTRYWQPETVKRSKTRILGFEEVAPLDGLQSVVLVTDVDFRKPITDGYMEYFPKSVKLTLVAPAMEKVASGLVHKRSHKIIVCVGCFKEGFSLDGNTAINMCRTCKFIGFIPHFEQDGSQRLKAKLLILKYETHIRVVVTSASLTRSHWERFSNVGWYKDFPQSRQKASRPKRFLAELKHLCYDGLGIFINEISFDGYDFSTPEMLKLVHTNHDVSPHPSYYGIHQHSKASRNTFSVVKDIPTKIICQTTSIGPKDSANLFSDIFNLSRVDFRGHSDVRGLKILYPSQNFVNDSLSILNAKSSEILSEAGLDYLNKVCRIGQYLHDLRDSQGIIPTSNVYTQYVDLGRDQAVCGGEPGRLGWLLIGSQTLGYGSWTEVQSKEQTCSFSQFEVGVGLYPLPDKSSGVQHAVDLSQFCFPCHTSAPYQPDSVPYSPDTQIQTTEPVLRSVSRCSVDITGKDDNKPVLYQDTSRFTRTDETPRFTERYQPGVVAPIKETFLGRVDRIRMDRNCCFVDELDPDHPLADVCAKYPPSQTRYRSTAYLSFSDLRQYGISCSSNIHLLDHLVLFRGFKETGSRRGFKVCKVLKYFYNLKDAIQYFQPSEEISRKEAKIPQEKAVPDAVKPVTENERLENVFRGNILRVMAGETPSVEEVESITMEPIKMQSDMKWLEKHYATVCHGKENIPNPLQGPMALCLLIKDVMDIKGKTMTLREAE